MGKFVIFVLFWQAMAMNFISCCLIFFQFLITLEVEEGGEHPIIWFLCQQCVFGGGVDDCFVENDIFLVFICAAIKLYVLSLSAFNFSHMLKWNNV